MKLNWATSLLALVAFISTNVIVKAGIPACVKVKSTDRSQLTFVLSPQFISTDTIHLTRNNSVVSNNPAFENSPAVDDSIIIRNSPDARVRVVGSGSNTVTQWIVSFDVIVPSKNGFALSVDEVSSTTDKNTSMWQYEVETDLLSQPLQDERIQISYQGIARDRHIATVSCVVGESKNGKTELFKRLVATIHFAPGMARVLPSLDLKNSLTLDVVNPKAPWFTELNQSKSKVSDQVQGESGYDNVYRIKIEKEGIYRINAEQLKAAGIPTDAMAAKSIHMFSNGGFELSEDVPLEKIPDLHEQPIIVKTNSDGSISSLMFYASGPSGFQYNGTDFEHYIHHYATSAGYVLTWGGNDGVRASPVEIPSGPTVNQPLNVTGRVFVEDELFNPYTSGSGRRWMGRSIENNGSLSVSTLLPGLLRTGDVGYRFVVGHKGSKQGAMTIHENGVPIAQRVIPEVPKYMDTYTAPTSGKSNAAALQSDSRSVLKFNYSSSDNTAIGVIDWFEIHYPRAMVAESGVFEFWTGADLNGVSEFSVSGFGPEVYCFDVTNRWSPLLTDNSMGGSGTFTIKTELTLNTPKRYFTSSSILGVQLEKIGYKNYRTQNPGADLVLICHPSLETSANSYKDYRSAKDGMKVVVATTDELYGEFSYGVQDPTALRDFIAHAVRSWTPAPKYILLWGDGHYDYKNISTQTTNFVVPYESLDPDDRDWGLFTYTSDDYFSRVVGQDLRPDVAIGRLPVTSNVVGNRLLDKIKNYEGASATDDWRTRVTLVADDGSSGNGVSDQDLHLAQSETLINYYVPNTFQPKKIYLVEYPTENVASGRRKPGVTQDLVSTINTTGSLTLNWIGHGNPRVWAHEGIFERETTPPLLTNHDKPFFLTAATCDFSRFDLTETQSGAEELLLLANGGAIGVFSATRVVFAYQNAEINQEFHKTLFSRGEDGKFPRLGDVLYNVKQKFFAPNDEKFYLLGDPTLRLLVPENQVLFSSINNQNLVDSEKVVLQSLSTVQVDGFVAKPFSIIPDVSFNGVITISLLDAEKRVTVIDNDERKTVNKFTVPGAALNKGTFKVVDGKFTATFVIPKDIAFSSETAKIYGYAYSSDERTAMGVTNKVSVDGVANASFDDGDGPQLKIYMDSRFFNSGQVVRSNPILIVDMEDETGINSTGIGIGHELEASFDNGEQIVNLTQNVSTSLENSRAATAQKQIFDLAPGLHTVRVRAWDVLNNFNQASIEFRILKQSDGVVTSWVSNYPNPFSSSTTIRYQHNIATPFSAQLQVYDQQGRQIYTSAMVVRDMQTAEISWDGVDINGAQLSSGVYLCMVRVTDELGIISDITGKVSLIR